MNMQTSPVIVAPEQPEAHTPFPGSLIRLNAAAWLAALALGLLFAVPAAMRYERKPDLTIVDGRLALDFEHYITREHPFRQASLNGWAALDYVLFREGKPGVIVGDQGWLFSSEEFPLPSAVDHHLQANVAHIRRVVEELAVQGIRVVVLPVPEKAEIHSAHVPDRLRPRILPLSRVGRELDAAGLEWLDLRRPFMAASGHGIPPFFRTETHWTPEGARIAAAHIRDWLLQQPGLQWQPQAYGVERQPAQPLESDLENYLPLRPLFGELLPAAEQYTPTRVVARNLASNEDALFGNTGNTVALVGTSYSADERWNLPGWLRLGLQTDIDNVSEKGKGPFVPMDRFRALVKDGQTGAKVVIWEMPVRVLAMDLGDRKPATTH